MLFFFCTSYTNVCQSPFDFLIFSWQWLCHCLTKIAISVQRWKILTIVMRDHFNTSKSKNWLLVLWRSLHQTKRTNCEELSEFVYGQRHKESSRTPSPLSTLVPQNKVSRGRDKNIPLRNRTPLDYPNGFKNRSLLAATSEVIKQSTGWQQYQ